jgi:hypothetical protein
MMQPQELEITADGVLSFSIRDDGDRPWWWYLDIHGEPLYLISNACGTCSAIFQRVHDQGLPLTPRQLSAQLEAGLTSIPQAIIDTVAVLLPRGNYRISLLTFTPSLIMKGNQPYGVGCEADYFWLWDLRTTERSADYEIALPLVPYSELNADRVAFYQAKVASGKIPTALALSLYDGRAPMGRYSQTALAHFLLDGHHKMLAASQLSRPITLLSFLRLQGIEDALHRYRKDQPPIH